MQCAVCILYLHSLNFLQLLQCCSIGAGMRQQYQSWTHSDTLQCSGTQYCSDPKQSFIGAPLPPWRHPLMTRSYIEMVVGLDGVMVMVWPSAVPVASVLWCRDQGVTRIMDNCMRIATDKHRHYSLYYLDRYTRILAGRYTIIVFSSYQNWRVWFHF